MTKPETALRELAEKLFLNYFIMGIDVADVGMPSFDMLKSAGIVDKNISDLTALISEGYVSKEEHDKVVQQRDELKEALAEQKRLYFNLFDEEIRCMYCEAEISRGSAIILCKECAENTEL